MGTYILFTINHRVAISKKELLDEGISFEEMMEAVNEAFPVSAYDLIKREHIYECRQRNLFLMLVSLRSFWRINTVSFRLIPRIKKQS